MQDCESLCWGGRPYTAKYTSLLNQEIHKGSAELHSATARDPDVSAESDSKMGAELVNKRPEAPGEDQEETDDQTDDQDVSGEVTEELKNTTTQGSGTSALSPQQSYVQYQHSYPYLHLCDPSNHAYRVMSPALVSSYAGNKTTSMSLSCLRLLIVFDSTFN